MTNMTGWKKWPYWARGGVIAFILAITTTVLGFSRVVNLDAGYSQAIYFIFLLPLHYLESFARLTKSGIFFNHETSRLFAPPTFFGIIITICFYCVVGIFLGLLCGKIKNRKTNN